MIGVGHTGGPIPTIGRTSPPCPRYSHSRLQLLVTPVPRLKKTGHQVALDRREWEEDDDGSGSNIGGRADDRRQAYRRSDPDDLSDLPARPRSSHSRLQLLTSPPVRDPPTRAFNFSSRRSPASKKPVIKLHSTGASGRRTMTAADQTSSCVRGERTRCMAPSRPSPRPTLRCRLGGGARRRSSPWASHGHTALLQNNL
jgi:hypothetical protein